MLLEAASETDEARAGQQLLGSWVWLVVLAREAGAERGLDRAAPQR